MKGHRLLLLTTCLLPIATIPLELIPGGIGLAPLVFGLVLYCGLRYRAFNGGRVSAVELVAAVLLVWVSARLLLIAPLSGEPVNWAFAFREVAVLIVAVIAFRLARRDELKPTLVRGLGIGLASLLVHEAYQVLVGLPALQAAGYTNATGYYFYTFEGTYRPFGTFPGPTVFGAYLAMVGVAYILTLRRPGRALLIGALVVVGVVLTQTRSAWLGTLVAVVTVAATSRGVRRAASVAFIPAAFALTSVVLVWPQILASVVERAASVANQGDTSRVTRTAIWQAVAETVADQSLASGFGSRDWIAVMTPTLGPVTQLGHAHSNYFQEAYRYGLVGALLFVLLLSTMIASVFAGRRAGVSLWPAALGGVLVFAVDSVFNNSLSSLNFVVTVFLIAGLGSVDYARQPQPHPEAMVVNVPEGATSRPASGSKPSDRNVDGVDRQLRRGEAL